MLGMRATPFLSLLLWRQREKEKNLMVEAFSVANLDKIKYARPKIAFRSDVSGV